jgi:CubicO group peptidase (beta-lactamase class C family)
MIETVSRRSYDAYVDQRIFAAAGMRDSGNAPEATEVRGLAIAYTQGPPGMRARGEWRAAADLLPYRGTSAGGGYSTVGDLLKFARALEGGKLLDAGLLRLATTGQVYGPAPQLRYGYGFEEVRTPAGARRIGHGGGAPGMNGVLWIYPESRLVIVVLANRDPPAAEEMARYIDARLR